MSNCVTGEYLFCQKDIHGLECCMTPPNKTVKPYDHDPTDQKSSDGGSTDYYSIPDGASDLLDLIDARGMSFSIGNIFKACYRLGEKEGVSKQYDLRKIVFFALREYGVTNEEVERIMKEF